MCGICAVILQESLDSERSKNYIKNSQLIRRGPDIQNALDIPIDNHSHGVFYGSTLHFRGTPTRQPLQDDSGNLLLWNGEIFGGVSVKPDENDGSVLLRLLSACQTAEELLAIFAKIQGPWSFVFYQASTKSLWFGRDIFGRRSLLFHHHHEGFMIASIAIEPWFPWKEIPAVGIYCACFNDDQSECSDSPTESPSHTPETFTLYHWAEPSIGSKVSSEAGVFNKTLMSLGNLLGDDIAVTESSLKIRCPLMPFNTKVFSTDAASEVFDLDIPKSITELANEEQKELANRLVDVLQAAVLTRTACQSTKCSDCIQSELKAQNTRFDSTELVNGFEKLSTQSPDQLSNLVGCAERPPLENLLTLGTPSAPLTSGDHLSTCGHSRVAVLFSGGVDSLIIAALADRCVPQGEPIDLLNVAFEHPKKVDSGKGKGKCPPETKKCVDYDVPDRQTGREGLQQLQHINPHRKYNFVEINISVEELRKARLDHVKDLVYPLTTVLDDSIGCAIWFASRGRGVITNPLGDGIPYTSPARMVLVGMGADEQFAGYSRHRVKFNTDGWPALVREIQMEIERISSRNLGRDDRVISDHGRESRFPFLDENVVSFLNALPLSSKTNLSLPRGLGEKFLLRLAAESVGLTKGAVAPKRAIQFGSRIAKAENRKEKGSDVCNRVQ